MRRAVETARAPRPVGAYSQAVAAGGFVFCAGQIGIDPATGSVVPGGVAAEAGRALENLAAVLEVAGLTLDDVVKTTVFLVDIADAAVVNDVYRRYFADPAPARSTVAVAALPLGARIEIEAVAAREAAG